jgi:hypothetical protein
MFELPLDGNTANRKWIFWGGSGNYFIGTFDGNTFNAQSGPFTVRGGDCFAVTQTFNDYPGDARRIMIVHGTAQFPGMPFNNNLNFPADLTLRTSPSGARLYANPVPELALLRTSTNVWPAQALISGSNVMSGTTGEAFELDASFQPGSATSITFTLRGTAVTYNRAAQTIVCNSTTQPLAPSNGVVHLEMLVDRGIIEIFGNDGLLYMPMRVTPTAGARPVSLTATGSGAALNSLMKHNLGSAWNVATLPASNPPAYQIGYWSMEAQITAPNNSGTPTFSGVADSATNSGQGIFTTGTLLAAIDDLITFNGIGNAVTLSTNVPPASMFVNGHTGGDYSYNAEAITNVDGVLFFPQDQYGDELDFTGSFSLELFFKTDGNRSGSGIMQLISQGTDSGYFFRCGINVNESGSGGLRFKIANSNLARTSAVDVMGANYADGQWHYLLAVCDTLAGSSGQMRLTIANQDGSQASATNNLSAGFLPLPTANNGNLFLGRYTYSVSQTPRTFLGFVDEVQITSGVVSDSARVGKIPANDNYPKITGALRGTNNVRFQWTGAAATNFIVEWVGQLGNVWQAIATMPSANSLRTFVDANTNRLNGATGFYRIASQ